MEIERDELQQIVVFHLGQEHVGAAFEQIFGETAFGVNELIDALFNRPAADELVHEHVLGLPELREDQHFLLPGRDDLAIKAATAGLKG